MADIKNINEMKDEQITDAGVLVIAGDGKIIGFARKGNLKKLGLPAGKRKPGEKIIAAAKRELLEEIGIEVEIDENEPIFVYQPDDKQQLGVEEYCATYIVSLPEKSTEVDLKVKDENDEGVSKGFGLWVTPKEFVASGNSAFEDYNTTLLKFAGLLEK